MHSLAHVIPIPLPTSVFIVFIGLFYLIKINLVTLVYIFYICCFISILELFLELFQNAIGIFIFIVFGCFAYMYICVPCEGLVPIVARRVSPIP